MKSRHCPYACGMLMTLVIWSSGMCLFVIEHLVHGVRDLADDLQVLEAPGQAVQRHRY